MNKWKLLITTLPVVAVVLALTFLRDQVLNLSPLLSFGDLSPILIGAAVLVGFMLTGVLSDYKESERIPAQFASALMGIEDDIVAAREAGKEFDNDRVRDLHVSITVTTTDWFLNRAQLETCLETLGKLNAIIGVLDRAGAVNSTVGLSMSRQALRGLVTRVETIRRTRFMPAGWVLLYLLVGVTSTMLVFAQFTSTRIQYVVVGALTLIYIYLIRLINDIDNPFDYLPNGESRRSAEVDPEPLVAYCKRVQASVEVPKATAQPVT